MQPLFYNKIIDVYGRKSIQTSVEKRNGPKILTLFDVELSEPVVEFSGAHKRQLSRLHK